MEYASTSMANFQPNVKNPSSSKQPILMDWSRIYQISSHSSLVENLEEKLLPTSSPNLSPVLRKSQEEILAFAQRLYQFEQRCKEEARQVELLHQEEVLKLADRLAQLKLE